MLVDTHAHLNLEPLFNDWQEYLNLAIKAGVEKVIVPGTNSDTSHKALMMAKERQEIVTAVGIHPEEIKENVEEELNMICRYTNDKTVVAIGEVGLDYQLDKIDIQRWLFKEQLAIARDHNLAVLIHTRRSQAIYDAYEDIKSVYGDQKFRGVFHCFTGSKSHYDLIQNLGCFIGIGGLITYSHNNSMRKVIKSIPLDKMVLETDAPWLTPHPKQEPMNHPGNVVITALKLAEVLEINLSEVMQITTQNALRLIYDEIN